VQHAADTGMVRHLIARTGPDNLAAQQILRNNGFELTGPTDEGLLLRFERAIEPAGEPLG
jgi:RimJ/RimL family protein N-acetyltransferase